MAAAYLDAQRPSDSKSTEGGLLPSGHEVVRPRHGSTTTRLTITATSSWGIDARGVAHERNASLERGFEDLWLGDVLHLDAQVAPAGQEHPARKVDDLAPTWTARTPCGHRLDGLSVAFDQAAGNRPQHGPLLATVTAISSAYHIADDGYLENRTFSVRAEMVRGIAYSA